MQQYLSTDPNAGRPQAGARGGGPGGASGGYLSTDPNAGKNPAPPAIEQDADGWLDSAMSFGKGFLNAVNPLPGLKAMYEAGPVETIKGLTRAQIDQFKKGQEAYQQGRVSESVGHTLAGLLPLLGPAAANTGEKIGQGDIAEGLGEAAGLISPAVLSAAARTGARARVPAPFKNNNPVAREAVDFATRENIPVDAGTASGNRFVRGTQALADRSPIGSVVAERAAQRTSDALRETSDRLAQRAHPQPIVPEQAGEGIRAAIEGQVRTFKREADAQYDTLRRIEDDPANLDTITKVEEGRVAGGGKTIPVEVTEQIPMAVDLREAKAALKPLYDRLTRQLPVTQQRASKGLHAIENILNGPDVAPFSQVDLDLSSIKELARGADLPELRDLSKGLAARSVRVLETAVRDRARQAGPEAIDALMAGRAAVRSKVDAAKVLKVIREEPVQAFSQAVWAKDAGIQRLRSIQRYAPEEMAKVGRAFLEQAFDQAKSQGGFDKAGTLWNAWDNLGPQTKRILFKPELAKDLDSFFMLAKKTAENVNPSGTALTAASWSTGLGLLWVDPLTGATMLASTGAVSKALRTPSIVKLLVKGMSVPISNKTAASAAAAQISRVLGEHAKPLSTVVEREERTPAPIGRR